METLNQVVIALLVLFIVYLILEVAKEAWAVYEIRRIGRNVEQIARDVGMSEEEIEAAKQEEDGP